MKIDFESIVIKELRRPSQSSRHGALAQCEMTKYFWRKRRTHFVYSSVTSTRLKSWKSKQTAFDSEQLKWMWTSTYFTNICVRSMFTDKQNDKYGKIVFPLGPSIWHRKQWTTHKKLRAKHLLVHYWLCTNTRTCDCMRTQTTLSAWNKSAGKISELSTEI